MLVGSCCDEQVIEKDNIHRDFFFLRTQFNERWQKRFVF